MAKSSKNNSASTPPSNAVAGSARSTVAVKQPSQYFSNMPTIKKYWQERMAEQATAATDDAAL